MLIKEGSIATNFVSQISQFLVAEIASRVASGLGLDKTSTQKAIAAAVPAILGALISLVSKSQGATKLSDAVAMQEPGVLSSLASVIGQPGQKALIDNGSSALSSLLGGKILSGISSALSQYAGIGQSSSNSLLGLLAPVVLGVLGSEQRNNGLDASGLAKLLTSQKDAVAAALPSGFSKYLKDAGVLDSVTAATTKPAQTARPRSSIWPWLLACLALLVVGFLALHFLSRHRGAVEVATPNLEAPYSGLFDKLRGVKVGDVDVGELSKSAVNDLYTSLVGMKDAAAAQADLPGLTKASSEFDQLDSLLNQLSPENRKMLADVFASIKPNLDQLLDKAVAIPGVGAVIKPTVDAIRSKLDVLTTI